MKTKNTTAIKPKHTAGQWRMHPNGIIDSKCFSAITIATVNTDINRKEQCEANCILVSQSPNMFSTLAKTYLKLLLDMPSEYRNSTSGQLLLGNLLSSIKPMFGDDERETHDIFEDLYCRVKYGKITFAEAMEEIIEPSKI